LKLDERCALINSKWYYASQKTMQFDAEWLVKKILIRRSALSVQKGGRSPQRLPELEGGLQGVSLLELLLFFIKKKSIKQG
jgi:hypothetical protein